MRVAVDGEPDPGVAGGADVIRRQVQPLRRGVDLQRGAGAGAGPEQLAEVHLDRRALAHPPGGGVADDVDVRVLTGGNEPPGHLRPGLLEVRVHRGDADIEPGQEVRVPVHRAVRADVELGAVQQHEAPGEVCCQRPHLLPLGQHLLVGHPLHDQVRRVVGDGVVLVSAPPRRVGHRLERGHPVGEVGVRVQVPSQVIDPNEPGYLPPRRRLDLPAVLAHGRGHPRQPQPFVDLLLGPRDDQRVCLGLE